MSLNRNLLSLEVYQSIQLQSEKYCQIRTRCPLSLKNLTVKNTRLPRRRGIRLRSVSHQDNGGIKLC